MGNEISYPLKPFLVESWEAFWDRCLSRHQPHELQDAADQRRPPLLQVFSDLKSESGQEDKSGSSSGWTGEPASLHHGSGFNSFFKNLFLNQILFTVCV